MSGRFDTEGYFVVDTNDREPGRCDSAGFLLNSQGVRVQDQFMAERVRKRAYMLPQADESRCKDPNSNREVKGSFDKDGYFLIDHADRN